MQYTHTNEQEIKQIMRQMLVLAAKHLGISYPELEDSFVLHEEIKKKNEKLYGLLNEFSEAYLTFYYTASSYANKKSIMLTDAEKERLYQTFESKEKIKQQILKEISS